MDGDDNTTPKEQVEEETTAAADPQEPSAPMPAEQPSAAETATATEEPKDEGPMEAPTREEEKVDTPTPMEEATPEEAPAEEDKSEEPNTTEAPEETPTSEGASVQEAPATEAPPVPEETPEADKEEETETPSAKEDSPSEDKEGKEQESTEAPMEKDKEPSEEEPKAKEPTTEEAKESTQEPKESSSESTPIESSTEPEADKASTEERGEAMEVEQSKEEDKEKEPAKETTEEEAPAEKEKEDSSKEPEKEKEKEKPAEEEAEEDSFDAIMKATPSAPKPNKESKEASTDMDTSTTSEEVSSTQEGGGGGGISIASVSSLSQTSEEEGARKSPQGLKLASFADMGSNGITDDTPVGAMAEGPCCGHCSRPNTASMGSLVWETMLFCNDTCLGDYAQEKLSNCASCGNKCPEASMGKYCVRFGDNVLQFCSTACLDTHKKGLKLCAYCQVNLADCEAGSIVSETVSEKVKEFCGAPCHTRFLRAQMTEAERKEKEDAERESADCDVCGQNKPVDCQLLASPAGSAPKRFCSSPCMGAFKFTNSMDAIECALCKKSFDLKLPHKRVLSGGSSAKNFCSRVCHNAYVMRVRKIVGCTACKVKKYNFDMVEHWLPAAGPGTFCSLTCLRNHRKSAAAAKPAATTASAATTMPVIQSVSSLAGSSAAPAPTPAPAPAAPQVQIQTQTIRETVKEVMVHMREPVKMINKSVSTKPVMQTKGVSCRPHPCHKETQTDGPTIPALVPMVVPMYMPMPMQMYQAPYPVPVPVPIPVPVPVFIPTTRNSTRGIMKQIKKIQAKIPKDPFEAELLAMAGALVGGGAKGNNGDEEMSDDSLDEGEDGGSNGRYTPEASADDAARMVHRVATPAADFENEIQGGRIVPKPLPMPTPDPAVSPGPNQRAAAMLGRTVNQPATNYQQRSGQKRRYSNVDPNDPNPEDPTWNSSSGEWTSSGRRTPSRTPRSRRPKTPRTDNSRETSAAVASIQQQQQAPQQPKERPDAKHHLKFTYGVNAWKHWVVQKNAELEKARAQGRYMKTFETDILKLRADELNYTLCMFVKEVKKPNGDNYAPDSVLYLALGIQEYLFENGRIDNIFTDQYYEPFTSSLHEVVKDFKLPVNELGYFVTRIEEEHLWESKQLGAHSPQVLLNTLIYFNTKYFMLKNEEQHKKLSFSSIMKHWKKGQGGVIKPGAVSQGGTGDKKTILLRYYPAALKGSRERKCYEQHESAENPLRCPVKLYEFYLSKCPETSKTRSDMFYLQPERSCVPDSPVWYSNQALNPHQLDKMLQRLLMVREIQEHMLADAS